jgi:alpha-L-fucosidase
LYTGPHGAAERPDEWLLDRWEGKLYEVVDAYRPDLIWFEVLSVTALGVSGELRWRRSDDGLSIEVPRQLNGGHAYTFKIQLAAAR